MSATLVQAEYDSLATIQRRFAREAEQTLTLQRQLQRHMSQLLQSGWQGRGAAAFNSEMQSEILPALQRLQQALASAQGTVQQISSLLHEAEQEAAQLFQGQAEGVLSSVGASVDTRLGIAETTSPTVLSAGKYFEPDYMNEVAKMKFQGQGDPLLNTAMETLLGNPTAEDRQEALRQIAESRGLSQAEVAQQYSRFKELQRAAVETGRSNGQQPLESINLYLHGDFLGSQGSLRFGKVVGDALGLDPVFGSLLQPTGGLVGPDNKALNLGNSPLAVHGSFHDAAGYLYNQHDLGPGYDYLGLENRDTSNPLTGQESGISYWNAQLGASLPYRVITQEGAALCGNIVDMKQWADTSLNNFQAWYGNVVEGTNQVIRDSAHGVTEWFVDQAQEQARDWVAEQWQEFTTPYPRFTELLSY